eukprot:Pgem_evm2s5908
MILFRKSNTCGRPELGVKRLNRTCPSWNNYYHRYHVPVDVPIDVLIDVPVDVDVAEDVKDADDVIVIVNDVPIKN